MISVDETLDALDFSRAEPGIGYLERLFAVFNSRVLFETASKIVRDADVPQSGLKPRRPDIFWAEHREAGAGGTCFARVAAFEALAAALGFPTRLLLGAVRSEGDHCALAVTAGAREWICDVGFPLPAPLPRAEGETDTAQGVVRLSKTARGWKAEVLEGVPDGPRALEIFEAPVSFEEFSSRWEATFLPGSDFLSEVVLRKQLPDRILSFKKGEVRIDDLHSRTRIPIASPRVATLARIFGLEPGLLERAFAIAGEAEPGLVQAEISVFLETRGTPEKAFAAIASLEGYTRLLEGAARVYSSQQAGSGWRLHLDPPGSRGEPAGALIEERIAPDSARRQVEVERGGRRSFYEAAERAGRTYLIRRAVLPWSGDEALRNDSLRGRLAGTLAGDLLAWRRLLQD